MIQVGICDDDSILLSQINQFTTECYNHNHIFALCQNFNSSKELLYEIEDGTHFDLLLLDIEMPQINGMDLVKRVKQYLPDILVIFITSHLEYVLDAFELSIFRYIPKVDYSTKLEFALLDAAKRIQVQLASSYIIQNQNKVERILLKNLAYITHEGKYALLYTTEPNIVDQKPQIYKVRKSLQQIYDELPKQEFLFIDRGCIVNLTHISGIDNNICILTNQTKLAISQSRIAALKEKLLFFWSQNI